MLPISYLIMMARKMGLPSRSSVCILTSGIPPILPHSWGNHCLITIAGLLQSLLAPRTPTARSENNDRPPSAPTESNDESENRNSSGARTSIRVELHAPGSGRRIIIGGPSTLRGGGPGGGETMVDAVPLHEYVAFPPKCSRMFFYGY